MNTYALTMSPVAMCLEELIPSSHAKSYMYSILIRTALVVSTLFVGLSIPFFGNFFLHLPPCLLSSFSLTSLTFPLFYNAGLVMSLIGSLLTMLVVSTFFTFPCYLLHHFSQRNSLSADLDSTMRVLLEHLKGQNYPTSGNFSHFLYLQCHNKIVYPLPYFIFLYLYRVRCAYWSLE